MLNLVALIAAVFSVALPAAPQDGGPEVGLKEALRSALGTNEQLAQVEEEVLRSHLYRRQAWLAIVPTATFTGTLIRNNTDQKIEFDIPGFEMPGGGAGGFVIQPLYDYSMSLSARQQVYLGGRIRTGLQMASLSIDISNDFLDQATRDTLLQVGIAYAQVEKAQRNLEISREALELAESQLDQAKLMFRVGEAVRTSVLRAESLTVQAERQVILADAVLEKAKENLSLVSGIDLPFRVKPMDKPALPSEDLDELLRIGLRTRIELEATDKQMTMADLQRSFAHGERMPSVDVAFNFTKQRAAFPSDQFWRIFVNINVPIYDGGAATIKRAQAEADRRQLELQKRLQTKQIRADIIQAYLDFTTVRKSLESARKELELVERTYEDINRFYAVGEATDLERENAYQQLNTTRRMLANLETDEVVALFSLRRSLGLQVIELAEE